MAQEINYNKFFLAAYTHGAISMFLVSAYFVYTPIVLDSLKITETEFALGITIFAFTNITINQIATRFLLPKIGTSNCLIIARLVYALIPFLIFYIPKYEIYILLHIFWGVAHGLQGPSIFTQIAILESKTKKILNPIFKSCFSTGAIFGALLSSFCLGLEVDSKLLFAFIGVFIFLSSISMYFFGLPKKLDYVDKSPRFSLPSKTIFLFGLINMIGFAAFGIILNWSSLWFINDLMGPIYLAGFILVFFNIGEISANIIASKLIKIFNEKFVGPYMTIIGSLILIFTIVTQNIYLILIGITIFGFSSSNLGPIVFRQAIKYSKDSIPKTMSHVSSIGMSGFIFGPAIVGFSAERFGLTFNMYALCFVFISISILMTFLMNQKKAEGSVEKAKLSR